MDFINALVLGIVQGLAEFLPISSSGHLILAHDLLRFNFIDNVTFDVTLHVGTLVALLLVFGKDILGFIIAFFQSLAKWDWQDSFDQRMAWFLIIGSIPAAFAGLLLEDLIVRVLRHPFSVAIAFAAGGVLLLIFERISSKSKTIQDLRLRNVFLIGVAQTLALIPGVSRSGITIVAGLSQQLTREQAARLSFLLAIPVVFGAGVKKLYDVLTIGLTGHEWAVLMVGLVAASAMGYFTIRFLLRYLQTHSLAVFAYYRFLVAAIIMIALLVS